LEPSQGCARQDPDVKDEAVIDGARQHVDAEKLDLIGRMEGGGYRCTRECFRNADYRA
jgi:hypothetical protein